MISNPSLPSVPDGLHVDELTLDADGLLITARTTATQVSCPTCGRLSMQVHSFHWRALHDLPWHDRVVTWRVKVRRFRCDHCLGRTFTERVSGLASTKVRRSVRLAEAQTDIGMVLGGEAGARLSRRLAMPISGDTVLRLIRRRRIPPCPPPRVVGIDDWAWRRGRSYGTIVCDLEQRRIIDLLPGRSAAPMRDWLLAHPSVTVISRDRLGPYAEAASAGAPGTTQVADRWHLLVNASEALRAVVERHQPEIREAAHQCMPVIPAPTSTIAVVDPPVSKNGGRRAERCEAALRLHDEGLSIKEIARHLRASRNSAALYRELQALGFDGGYNIVRRWTKRLRQGMAVRPPSARIPSTRRITRWLTSDPATLSGGDRRFVEALGALAPRLSAAAEHVRAFREILCQGEPAALESWLEEAGATDLRGFVAGLRQDGDTVRAAVVEAWSNGPVEGQVNRLKLIKRSMYGRAKFDLLRQRVLHAA